MRILIAAPVCVEYAERKLACEQTWGTTTLCDVKLYSSEDMKVPLEMDRCATDQRGEYIQAGQNLSYRVRELCRWALFKGHDFLFKCDDDTYVWVDRLLKSGFENHDYSGFSWGEFASGGAGYWLSAKAMRIVAEQEMADEPHDDVWVGKILSKAGIPLYSDARYHWNLPSILGPDFITVHYVKDPEVMRRIHSGTYNSTPKRFIRRKTAR